MRAMPNAASLRAAPTMLALCVCVALASRANAEPSETAAGCNSATTQAQLTTCAYDDFLATQAEMAAALRLAQQGYSAEQRASLRRVQRAWLGFRTEACRFESQAAEGGSAQPMLNWQCAARMTRERTAALAHSTTCAEGDLGCVRPAERKALPR
jgi:uncharacterized protein YecT (DUF1311 family)